MRDEKNLIRGFTIIELIVIIVVIGVLAAVTVVAYNGFQQDAKQTALLADLVNATSALEFDLKADGHYPETIELADNGTGLATKSGTSYQYTVDPSTANPSYCLTATNGTTSFFIGSNTNVPTEGGCPGDGIGGVAAIMNIITNPSFETANLSGGYSSYNGAPRAIVTSGCFSGSQCTSVNTAAGSNRGIIYQSDTPHTSDVSYVYSAYVKGPTGQVVVISARPTNSGSAYIGEGTGGQSYTLSGSWQRIVSKAVVLPATATRPGFQIRANTANALPFYVDSAMITEGVELYEYADGSSPNWKWSGAPNASTSTGPAL